MNYTLWSKDTLLARTTPFFPIENSGSILAFFHPADAWETIGAPLAAWANALPTTSRIIAEMLESPDFEELEDPERTRRFQQALIDDPHHRRLRDLKAAVDALGLELRDERVRVVARSGVIIAEMPAALDPDDDTRQGMADLGIEPSGLMLTATAGERAAGSSGQPAIPPSSDR